MNNNNDDIKAEPQPEPEIPESAQALDQTEPEPSKSENLDESSLEKESTPETKPESAPPSRFMRFLRKALIGLLIVALIFLAGFLTDHFVRYQPLADELDETQTELEQANQAVSDLEEENDRLTSANQAANEEIETLEAELTDARANLKFYQVLVNVNEARVELFLENIEGAQVALVVTQQHLEDLQPFIVELDPELALSLPRRLELIISGLERNPETGRIDLELFTKDLLELEPLLVDN